MNKLVARRFRVRDDGTGREWARLVDFSEFASAPAVIVLGDPGIGKTTFFRELGQDNYLRVRRFISNPKPPVSGPLFLDGLDEYRRTASGRDAVVEVAQALHSLGCPWFRLSCRAADWFGEQDQEVIRGCTTSARSLCFAMSISGGVSQVSTPTAYIERKMRRTMSDRRSFGSLPSA